MILIGVGRVSSPEATAAPAMTAIKNSERTNGFVCIISFYRACDAASSIIEPFHARARAVFALRKRGSETWSYADLDGCVDRLARGLRHAGLARGDRAAIIADNAPEWIAAALAVIRAGAVV